MAKRSPDAETARLAALHEYQLLDAPAGDELEAIVRVAAAVVGVPFATLNLIDESRQCQLTTVGFEGVDSDRDDSMCATHFLAGELVVAADARTDDRFAANPWVDGRLAAVRFYASAPLVTPQGHALGTLCVFDEQPGQLTVEQGDRLRDLAGVLLALFERKRQARVNARLWAEAEEQRELVELTTQALQERQTFTEVVLDTLDVAVVAAGPDGRLTLFNRTACDWHGLQADAAIDPHEHARRYDLFDADGNTPLPSEQVPLHRALVDGSVHGLEMVIAPADRRPLRVMSSGRAMVADDGTLLGAVVVMSDVTAARRQQDALELAFETVREREAQLRESNAELARSNSELGHFAAVAGHDLSAPLTAISGYVELLRDRYSAALDDRARDWLAIVLRSVRRMRELIEALLTYAEAGSSGCRREPVQTDELLQQALLDVAVAVADADALVSATTPLPELDGDPALLRQLLQNLLANSLKYRHQDRRCSVQISAAPTDDAWLFSVSDNGIGIPEDARKRVFEVFERVEGADAHGFGLGLATSQRVVERHGGTIWADETPGGGTTIHFTVPTWGAPADVVDQYT